ncbi:hypothetical protein NMD1_01741 [Novosphingobium sp. MD-1]|nr:hypothetical protein NMD1_01741 [Novosphingobium sp. MD-1]
MRHEILDGRRCWLVHRALILERRTCGRSAWTGLPAIAMPQTGYHFEMARRSYRSDRLCKMAKIALRRPPASDTLAPICMCCIQ